VETEQAFRDARGPLWRAEPFRVFFPLGVLLAWVGVSHWLLYRLGLRATYSCELHGFIQMQAFMMAFALGFLFTALPRRTRSAPPSTAEMLLAMTALLVTTGGALADRWWIAQAGYAAAFIVLLQFAMRRFLGRAAARRPPAAFVLIPIAIVHALVGAGAIAGASVGWLSPAANLFGRLLVEQGVFLCLVIGVGSLILPLIGGSAPPPDLGTSPRETYAAIAYAAIGIALLATFIAEQRGWARAAPLVRAALVAAPLAVGARPWRRPGKPGFHRRLVWAAVWLTPIGLAASAVLPDYRVPALHIVFIGGFGLMAFAVATHVSLGHLGLEHLATGRPPAVVALAIAFLLALMARLAADMSDTYFDHLAWASAMWLIGSAVWLAFLAPHFLHRTRQ
jgi:uncharacterized protein involved in response to NO